MSGCNNCPFRKSTPLNGSPEWLKDVLKFYRQDPYFSHSCHKTDKNADGWNGKTTKPKECEGHLQMIINEIDGTPGKGGVYNSIPELAQKYVDHYFDEINRRKAARALEDAFPIRWSKGPPKA